MNKHQGKVTKLLLDSIHIKYQTITISEIEKPPWRMPSGYFQAKLDLSTGNVTGIYYNTQSKVTFSCPQELSTLHEISNPRIPPFTSLDTHQDQTRLTKCKTSTPIK